MEIAMFGIDKQRIFDDIAFTMASGSAACNVFPTEATLGANMRFVHHQDMEESLEVMRRIAAKYDLEMEVVHGTACTRMIDYKGEVYRYVADTAAKTFPGCISSPYILTAATDATFYDEICDNCIRFAPIVYGQEEKKGIHGVKTDFFAKVRADSSFVPSCR